MQEFEWDERKNLINIEKHGLSLEDGAELIRSGDYSYAKFSPRYGENLWVAIGEYKKQWIAVVFTRRKTVFRIISVRKARKNEKGKDRAFHG